ncbi:MAG: hypothetical protein JNL32_08420 [Candidatus Kapabacteria bacterium]|nr:hypothetical protein [Candidatus Kapabacteria bacterium]
MTTTTTFLNIVILVFIAASSIAAADVNPKRESYISRILEAQPKQAAAMLDDILKTKTAVPIIEDTTALIIYKGAANDVAIRGDMTQWITTLPLKRIAGTQYAVLKLTLPATVRVGYELLVNGTPQPDPLNPVSEPSYNTTVSILEMPRYVRHRYNTRSYRPAGATTDTTFFNPSLPSSIRVTVNTPYGYTSTMPYPLMVFLDGDFYSRQAATTVTRTNMLGDAVISPSVAAYISYDLPMYGEGTSKPASALAAQMTDYIATTVIPWLRRSFSIRTTAEYNAVVAHGNGALNAIRLTDSVPAFFGKICLHSPVLNSDILMRFMTDAAQFPALWIDHDIYDDSTAKQMSIAAVSLVRRTGKSAHYEEYACGSPLALTINRLPAFLQSIKEQTIQAPETAPAINDPNITSSNTTQISTVKNNTTAVTRAVTSLQPALVTIPLTLTRPQSVFIEIRYERHDKKAGTAQSGVVEKLCSEYMQQGAHTVLWDSSIVQEQSGIYRAHIITEDNTFDIELLKVN